MTQMGRALGEFTHSVNGRRFVGFLFLAQFVLTASVKFTESNLQELLWLSHVALLTAALGLLFAWPRLAHVALCWVLIPHAMFLADLGCRLALGYHPVGISQYLFERGPWAWWGTLHHFYLVPTLLLLSTAHLQNAAPTLRIASGVFAALVVASRFLTDYNTNANYAHFIPSEWRASGLHNLNAVGDFAYLPILVTGIVLLLFVPSLAMVILIAKRRWAGVALGNRGELISPAL